MNSKDFVLASLVGGLGLVGCSQQEPTKAEVFKQQQRAVITPHGKIDEQSIVERDGGRISYRTTDGSWWSVDMERAADDQWRYGEPNKVMTPQ